MNSAGHHSMMGGGKRKLPDGVIAVQYIESKYPESYIDTGVYPDSCGRIEFDFAVTDVAKRRFPLQASGGTYGYFEVTADSYFKTERKSTLFCQPLTVYRLSCDRVTSGDTTVYLNGETAARLTWGSPDTSVYPFHWFFEYHDKIIINSSTSEAVVRIYGFRAYDTDLKVMADQIPVRTTVGGVTVGALYDFNTSSLIFNKGSGAFVIGPDI